MTILVSGSNPSTACFSLNSRTSCSRASDMGVSFGGFRDRRLASTPIYDLFDRLRWIASERSGVTGFQITTLCYNGTPSVADSPLDYQQTVLAEVVTEAASEGLLSDDDSTKIKAQAAQAESLTDIDQLWKTLVENYCLIEPHAQT